jgi:AraC family transcriptional regulator
MDLAESRTFAAEGVTIQVREHDWESPSHLHFLANDNLLILALPPTRCEWRMRFPEASGEFHPLGRAYFRPAGYITEVTGTGGHAHSLRCTFSPQRAISSLGIEDPWLADHIDRGCNLEPSNLLTILAQMRRELSTPQFAHAAMMETLLNLAIVELARYLRRQDVERSAPGKLTRIQLSRIEERVQCEVLQPPSVAELARLCGMSERHLLRLFQASTGDSVSSFIRRVLIQRAKRLLRETDTPLKQIAFHLGFSGPSSFTLAFRKATSITPGLYRKASTGSALTAHI